jgi:hypothetical protein
VGQACMLHDVVGGSRPGAGERSGPAGLMCRRGGLARMWGAAVGWLAEEDGPALAGLGLALAGVPALAGLRSGFSRFGLF